MIFSALGWEVILAGADFSRGLARKRPLHTDSSNVSPVSTVSPSVLPRVYLFYR